MRLKAVHNMAGKVISVFIGLHLFNHAYSFFGANRHIDMMNFLRRLYRNNFGETILFLAIVIQIISGLKLFIAKRKSAIYFFDKLQVYSGLYLSVFFLIHVGAVLAGRYYLQLDTNFYFGVAGLNTFPHNLFFVPYYTLGILSFVAHIAAIHRKRMQREVFGISPHHQSIIIIALGFVITLFIFFGLTNHFQGVEIPSEYKIINS